MADGSSATPQRWRFARSKAARNSDWKPAFSNPPVQSSSPPTRFYLGKSAAATRFQQLFVCQLHNRECFCLRIVRARFNPLPGRILSTQYLEHPLRSSSCHSDPLDPSRSISDLFRSIRFSMILFDPVWSLSIPFRSASIHLDPFYPFLDPLPSSAIHFIPPRSAWVDFDPLESLQSSSIRDPVRCISIPFPSTSITFEQGTQVHMPAEPKPAKPELETRSPDQVGLPSAAPELEPRSHDHVGSLLKWVGSRKGWKYVIMSDHYFHPLISRRLRSMSIHVQRDPLRSSAIHPLGFSYARPLRCARIHFSSFRALLS